MWEFLGWITKVCGWYVKVLHIFTGMTSIACLFMEFFGALHLWSNTSMLRYIFGALHILSNALQCKVLAPKL